MVQKYQMTQEFVSVRKLALQVFINRVVCPVLPAALVHAYTDQPGLCLRRVMLPRTSASSNTEALPGWACADCPPVLGRQRTRCCGAAAACICSWKPARATSSWRWPGGRMKAAGGPKRSWPARSSCSGTWARALPTWWPRGGTRTRRRTQTTSRWAAASQASPAWAPAPFGGQARLPAPVQAGLQTRQAARQMDAAAQQPKQPAARLWSSLLGAEHNFRASPSPSRALTPGA